MKIVHVITTLGVGGAEKHLLWLTEGQRRRGHDVGVVYLKGEGELREAFQAHGVTVAHVELGGLSRAPAAIGVLAAHLREVAPDVVHTHLLKADAIGALAARRARVATVVASKHNDERALLSTLVGLVHGWISRRVDLTIALSDHVARFVADHGRVPRERIRRVYYGVDASRLQPARPRAETRAALGLPETTRVLICVARFAPQKDHPTLLAALAELPDDVVLLLVGGDPFGDGERRLRERAAELDLGERVRFLGIRDDVPELLGASELFVMPSLWEGLGLVFLEAMAQRLPIVATDVSAVPEVVGREHEAPGGWLVPPGDPAALAAAIRTALDDPAERERRGAQGHARLLERFGLERMIDDVLAIYEEAAAR